MPTSKVDWPLLAKFVHGVSVNLSSSMTCSVSRSVFLSRCMFIYLSFCLSIYLVCLSICHVCSSICISICVSICQSICQYVCLSICLYVYLSVHPSVHTSLPPFGRQSVCLSFPLPLRLGWVKSLHCHRAKSFKIKSDQNFSSYILAFYHPYPKNYTTNYLSQLHLGGVE